ncbi:MAG: hypothetical protein A2Y38_22435 [Spirochaetes bacterium GWB1_59_5]|nr:MAG: hypothetical protein A2Y38_22435 [Spirochaetes bacterium GWB1_59_5]
MPGLPLADKSQEWDGAAAEQRLQAWASSDGSGDKEKMDWEKYAKAFMSVDSANKESLDGYKLPYADVIDGELKAVPAALSAIRGALSGARGGVDLPAGVTKEEILAKVDSYGKPEDGKEDGQMAPEGDDGSDSAGGSGETLKADGDAAAKAAADKAEADRKAKPDQKNDDADGCEGREDDPECKSKMPYKYPMPYPMSEYQKPAGNRGRCQNGARAPFLFTKDNSQYPYPAPVRMTDAKDIPAPINLCAYATTCPAKSLNLSEGGVPKAAYTCEHAIREGCPLFFQEVKMSFRSFGELNGIEIFATGVHKGKRFDESDLDHVAENFNKLREQLEPPMVLGHDKSQKILANSGMPALGWAKKVYREGDKLKADLKDVPDLAMAAINKGRYKRVSVTLYDDYVDGQGKHHGLTLRDIGLLGAEIPEVKNLQDIVSLDEVSQGRAGLGFSTYYSEPETKTSKEIDMADEKIVEELKALQARTKQLEEAGAKKDEKIKGMAEAMVKQQREKERAEHQAFVRSLSEDGKLAPKLIDSGIVAFMEGLDASGVVAFSETKKESPLQWFKEFLRELPQMIALGEESLETGGAGGGSTRERFNGTDSEVADDSAELVQLAEKAVATDPKYKDLDHATAFTEALRDASRKNRNLVPGSGSKR